MRILLATGLEEIDRDIVGELKRRDIDIVGECYYREGILALAKDKNADIVVISPHLPGHTEILDLIKELRLADIRVVFLPGRHDDRAAVEMSRKAVAHGVYDILWDKVKVKTVVNVIINPSTYAQAGIEPDEETTEGRIIRAKKTGLFKRRNSKENNNKDINTNMSKDRSIEKEKPAVTQEKPSARQMQVYTNQPEMLSKKYKVTPYITEADTAVIFSGNTRDAETAKETIINPACLVLENNSLSTPEVIRLALKGVAVVYDDSGAEIFLEHIQKNHVAGQEDQTKRYNKDVFLNIASNTGTELIKDVKNGEIIPNLFVTYSPSNGVGKTFVAVNSAMWLASKGVKTALVDLDVDKADLWHTTYMDALVGSPRTTVSTWNGSDNVLARHPELPMFVLPGTTVASRIPEAEDVKDILKSLAGQFDVVITDLNNMIRLSHIAAALKLARKIFLLSDLSEKCVIQTSMILSQALKIADIDRMSLVVNKIRPKQLYKPKDIANMFGFPGLSEVPEDVKLVNYCLKKKRYPVLTKSAVGESLRKLFSQELEEFLQADHRLSKRSLVFHF